MDRVIRPTIVKAMGSAGRLGLAMVSVALLTSFPAFPQSADLKPLLDRIQQLERNIRTLNIEVSRGGTGPAGARDAGAAPVPNDYVTDLQQAVARMEVRLTALETEARTATGRTEEVGHQLEQINQRLDKLIGDVDYRLGLLERSQAEMRGAASGPRPEGAGGGPQTSAVPAPQAVQAVPGGAGPGFATPPGVLGTLSKQDVDKMASGGGPAAGQPASPAAAAAARPAPQVAAPPVLQGSTPKEQYAYAFGLLRQTRYDDAEAALRAFLNANGNDPLAGNARYWLGETFYVRGNYVKAAEAFLEGYQKEPKGSKAADTLLKLGMSLANLDKKREACAAFQKVAKEFPDAPDTLKRLVTRERQKGGCE